MGGGLLIRRARASHRAPAPNPYAERTHHACCHRAAGGIALLFLLSGTAAQAESTPRRERAVIRAAVPARAACAQALAPPRPIANGESPPSASNGTRRLARVPGPAQRRRDALDYTR